MSLKDLEGLLFDATPNLIDLNEPSKRAKVYHSMSSNAPSLLADLLTTLDATDAPARVPSLLDSDEPSNSSADNSSDRSGGVSLPNHTAAVSHLNVADSKIKPVSPASMPPSQVINLATDRTEDLDEAELSARSDVDDDQVDLTAKIKASKRQESKDAFATFIKINQDKSREESSGESKKRKRDQESIIDKAREYQQELFDRAKEKNVIAVLDTGSGKTLIAAMLIKHTILSEISELKNGQKPRTVFFLVDSVHLVHQQARFIQTNLADKTVALWGDQKVDLWKRAEWETIFEQYRIVVCTAAILDQCLFHSYIEMKDIALIIFDEAHHAKKKHPYATIMRDYYHKAAGRRPKVFGMTASPIDSKNTDVARVVQELETLLDSHILTTSDLSILTFAPKPVDVLWRYDRLTLPYETALCQRLRPLCSFDEKLSKYFKHAKTATAELGPWLADKIWQLVLVEPSQQSSWVVKRFEQKSKYFESLTVMEDKQRALELVQSAVQHAESHDFTRPVLNLQNFSSKVLLLCDKLKDKYAIQPSTRAMVFVRDRLTAYLLHDLFTGLCFLHIRTGVLLGFGMSGPESSSRRDQEETMEQFRAGLINLIFATSVAEEGVDIPQCNLVVRFDLWNSTIQYMQSRGRARLAKSEFAIMIENGTDKQEDEIMYAQDFELYLKRYLQALPGDRLLGQGSSIDKMIAKYAMDGKSFTTDTGAICSFNNALVIIARYAASLAHNGALTKEIYEEEDVQEGGFRYTVRLPNNNDSIEVKGAIGERLRNKALAKRSAAFNCCYKLRMKGLLDSNLDSIFVKQKPHNSNAHLAVTDKQNQYAMKVKPDIWSEDLGVEPNELYATTVRFSPGDMPLERRPVPLVFLTRRPMPSFSSFPIFLGESNIEVQVEFETVVKPLPVSDSQMDLLTQFTLVAFADVYNKTYVSDATQMSYWLAPLNSGYRDSVETLFDLVDADMLTEAGRGRTKWGECELQGYENKWVVDPFDGRFHYFTESIVPGASIYDPIAEEASRHKKGKKNIIDFSDSRWRKSKKVWAEKTYDAQQPVFAAELIATRRNVLIRNTNDEECKAKYCQIAMQTLEVSQISPGVAATCLVWPVIIHRLEDYLLVKEVFEKLNLSDVRPELALEAFTKTDDLEAEGQVQSSGRDADSVKNYERLEFIGDSLLKMMTTITVYCRTKCDEEGMHCRRMEILCNRRLFDVSTSPELQLHQYIRTSGFNRTTWYPELVLLKGRGAKTPPEKVVHKATHDLGQKTIADVSEAIIGACITSQPSLPDQHHKFDLGIRAIMKLVQSEDHAILSWDDIRTIHFPEPWQLSQTDIVANMLARSVSQTTGYTFTRPRLLRSAFTHSSDQNSTAPDLQRLEFLGDAVLDWVSIEWLFRTNPGRDPQWLTEHKMAMVSNKFLACLAVKLGFHKHLSVTTPSLQAEISRYAAVVSDCLYPPSLSGVPSEVPAEVPRDFWTRIDKPPKALSDVVEAYLGAVLVDSNWDYAQIESFFNQHVLWFFENIEDYDSFANRHPTTYIVRKLQDEYRCLPGDGFQFVETPTSSLNAENGEGEVQIETLDHVMVGLVVHGQYVAWDSGSSVRYAKTRVSSKALKVLEGVDVQEFRRRFRCNCRSKDKGGKGRGGMEE